MRHIKNYTTVKRLMKQYFDKDEASWKKRLKEAEDTLGNPERWDGENKCYRYPSGSVCYEEDVEKIRSHIKKEIQAYRKGWEKRLEAADKAGKLLEINISVNWSRNRTFGMNPHAEAWVYFEDPEYGTRSAYGEGWASGCGYDKRSSAMGGALCLACKKKDDEGRRRDCMLGRASIDRFVIEHGEDLWKEYAVERTPFPHLVIGGKGSRVLTGMFRRIGYGQCCARPVQDYLIDYSESDRGSDVYHIIRKDRI